MPWRLCSSRSPRSTWRASTRGWTTARCSSARKEEPGTTEAQLRSDLHAFTADPELPDPEVSLEDARAVVAELEVEPGAGRAWIKAPHDDEVGFELVDSEAGWRLAWIREF